MSNSATSELSFRPFLPLVLLIALACLINYVDRGNLSVAAPTLKVELHLTPAHLGLLFSAFFYTYTAFIFVSGWLVDRFNATWVFVIGFAIWSLATAATGLVHGFAMLLTMRLLLGLGESVIFPCSSKVFASFVPERFRGVANGIMTSGMKSGPAVGTLGAGLLMARYGWRPVFIGIGLVSLLWLPVWIRVAPGKRPLKNTSESPPRKTLSILLHRSFLCATAGHFCSNYVMYFMVTWLPYYLVQERGLSLKVMPLVGSAYYACDAFAALSTGLITDFLVRSGHSLTRVRKFSMALGSVLAAFMLIGCAFAGPRNYLFWLMALGLSSGISGWGVLCFAQSLAGPLAAGKWAGLQNGFANFAGILSPMITGFLVHWTGRFTAPLGLAAGVALIGAFSWCSIVGPAPQAEEQFAPRNIGQSALPLPGV